MKHYTNHARESIRRAARRKAYVLRKDRYRCICATQNKMDVYITIIAVSTTTTLLIYADFTYYMWVGGLPSVKK